MNGKPNAADYIVKVAKENAADEFKVVDLDAVRQQCFNPKTTKLASPLHLAIKQRNYTMLKYFLEFNIDLNIVDNEGNSPIHILSRRLEDYDKDDIFMSIVVMLNNISDLNKLNNRCESALYLAITNIQSSKSYIHLLLQRGASLYIEHGKSIVDEFRYPGYYYESDNYYFLYFLHFNKLSNVDQEKILSKIIDKPHNFIEHIDRFDLITCVQAYTLLVHHKRICLSDYEKIQITLLNRIQALLSQVSYWVDIYSVINHNFKELPHIHELLSNDEIKSETKDIQNNHLLNLWRAVKQNGTSKRDYTNQDKSYAYLISLLNALNNADIIQAVAIAFKYYYYADYSYFRDIKTSLYNLLQLNELKDDSLKYDSLDDLKNIFKISKNISNPKLIPILKWLNKCLPDKKNDFYGDIFQAEYKQFLDHLSPADKQFLNKTYSAMKLQMNTSNANCNDSKAVTNTYSHIHRKSL